MSNKFGRGKNKKNKIAPAVEKKIRVHFNRQTGRIINYYRLKSDNRICPYAVVENVYTKKYAIYHSMKDDLIRSQGAFNLLTQYAMPGKDSPERKIIARSLLVNGVITYAKCFVSAEGRGGVKLEPKDVFKDNEVYMNYHTEIMKLRHQYFAHAGDGVTLENNTVCAVLNPDVNNKMIFIIDMEGHRAEHANNKIQFFTGLSAFVYDYVCKRQDAIRQKAMDSVNEMDVDELYKISVTPSEMYHTYASLPTGFVDIHNDIRAEVIHAKDMVNPKNIESIDQAQAMANKSFFY
jgi:hypothetical protein